MRHQPNYLLCTFCESFRKMNDESSILRHCLGRRTKTAKRSKVPMISAIKAKGEHFKPVVTIKSFFVALDARRETLGVEGESDRQRLRRVE